MTHLPCVVNLRLFLSPLLRPFSGASGQTMGDTYPHWLFMVNCDILPAFLQKVLLLRCKKVEKSPIQNYWCFACAWFKSDPFQPYWPVQHWQGWGVDISAVQEHWGPRTATQRGPKKVEIIVFFCLRQSNVLQANGGLWRWAGWRFPTSRGNGRRMRLRIHCS